MAKRPVNVERGFRRRPRHFLTDSTSISDHILFDFLTDSTSISDQILLFLPFNVYYSINKRLEFEFLFKFSVYGVVYLGTNINK